MRLLLLEDEPDLGAAIQKNLQQNRYIVDWFTEGDIAWEALRQNDYTLAVLDWMVPNLSGLDLCKRLRQHQKTLPILILTAKDAMGDRVQGLDAGADDYLTKPFGLEELLARLRALQRRTPAYQPLTLQVESLVLDPATAVLSYLPTGEQVTLTAKEFQLMDYFMRHPGQILTADQIRDRLWSLDSDAISNVVAAQIRLLRRKLAQLNTPSSIETLRGLGYRFNTGDAQETVSKTS